ncbi:putative metallo-hydrolase/oxidoreductase domain protein [Clostridioides difficile DA00129]|nr:putative metallo-hydrolase/oxidoreductase domain protein [Clostridioides difficile DA00129]
MSTIPSFFYKCKIYEKVSQKISEVKHLSISYNDPYHVKGIRIVEKIGYDFI